MNIYDISKEAGVSTATVSRVLSNSPQVSQKTKDKVLKVVERHKYVPNAFARGLGLNTMKTIGLLCPDPSDPYLAKALALIEQDFRAHHYNCLLSCTGLDLQARMQGVAQLKAHQVDGLVLMGSSMVDEQEGANDYLLAAAKDLPVVLLNGNLQGGGIYSVTCDDQQATCKATQMLLDTGCQKVLYLYHNNNYSGQQKLAGYIQGLESRNVPVRDALIHYLGAQKMGVDQVRDYLLALRSKNLEFDAVLTSEDSLGIGAVKYARVAGQSIPRQLSIVGYGNTDLCLCAEPELSTVDNRLQAICQMCVETMLKVLNGKAMPNRTIFPAIFIKRGSTR